MRYFAVSEHALEHRRRERSNIMKELQHGPVKSSSVPVGGSSRSGCTEIQAVGHPDALAMLLKVPEVLYLKTHLPGRFSKAARVRRRQ